METFPIWIYDGSVIDDPLGYGERAVRFLKALKHPKNPARDRSFPARPVAGAHRAAHLWSAP